MNPIQTRFAPKLENIQKEETDPKLLEAAQGMEAHFLNMLIENMRKTVQESDLTKDNHALQVFRGMLDQEYAQIGSKSQGIGLADLIVRQMKEMAENNAQQNITIRGLNKTDIIK